MTDQPDIQSGQVQGELCHMVERIERLETEKGEVAEQIKEVYAEAKGRGFDPKPIRKLVRARKKDKAKGLEERHLLETYALALGDLDLADLI